MNLAGLPALAPSRTDPILQRLRAASRVYCVGGAVRDVILGEAADDRDYLVTGATPQDMVEAGFRPVGKDFPVFLHPATHSEYALARTERKSGHGYKGFVFHTGPEVSLSEDLLRRDLRINAMAVDSEGLLHDPMGGLEDLGLRRLRHVSPAFREDPLRLIRLARFAARWPEFSIAEETLSLCGQIVSSAELGSLVPERIWTELEKGLLTGAPSRMVEVLDGLEAWPSLVGEGPTGQPESHPLPTLAQASGLGVSAEVLAGLLFQYRPAGRLSAVLPRPVQEWRTLLGQGLASPAWRLAIHAEQALSSEAGFASDLLDWVERADLYRRPDRAEPLLRLIWAQADAPVPEALATLRALIEALLSLPVGEVAKAATQSGRAIPEEIRAYRLGWLCDRLGCR